MLFDEELEKERSEKKKQLQERFMKKMKSNKHTNSSTDTVTIHSSKEYEELKKIYESEKKKRKGLEKSLKKADVKIAQLQKDKHSLKNEVKKSASLISSVRGEKSELTSSIRTLQAQLKATNEQVEQITKKAKHYELISNDARLPKLEKWNKDLLQKLLLQKKQCQSLKQQLRAVENKAKIGKTIIQAEKNQKQIEDILRLQDKIREMKAKIKSYQGKVQPDNLISNLEDFISEENLSLFFNNRINKLSVLVEKVNTLKKDVIQRERTKRKLLQLQNAIKENVVKIDERLGYITKRNSLWYFIDITKKTEGSMYHSFEVNNNYTYQKFSVDQPVKVIIQNNKADIIHMYKEVPILTHTNSIESSNNNNESIVPSLKEENTTISYPSFGDFTVLIVGARNLTEYGDRLTKHGLEVLVHNAFEESYTRLENKYLRADLVLVCTSHISHAVLDHINKENPKVELIERDNEDVIVARTRFASIQLGLVKIGNTTAS